MTSTPESFRALRHPLTIKQVAEVLGLHPQTLYKWVRAPGRIPHLRIGGTVRFDPDALARWIEAGSM